MCNILVSACVLGVNCRYNGIVKPNKEVMGLLQRKDIHLIPVCPEQLGGLPTPRIPSEIVKDGKVMMKDGHDVTAEYQRGAEEALHLAKLYDCSIAILKEKSPSCGHGEVYDGTFSGKLMKGNGITASLLLENGVKVIGESELSILIENLEINHMDIDTFWNKLKKHEGERFYTVRNLEFTYKFVSDNAIKVNRAEQILSKANFEKAIKLCPLNGPGDISKIVRGSAYVYGIITDFRMRSMD